MAFATIADEGSSELTIAGTSHVIDIGSPSNGQLVVVELGYNGAAGGWTDPTGWTLMFAQTGMAAWYRFCDGGEGATITAISGSSIYSAHHYWKIDGHDSGNAPEDNSIGSFDPPSLTPTGGAKDYLWLAFANNDVGGSPAVDTWPINYDDGQGEYNHTDAGNGSEIAWARRNFNAASDDPSTFGWTTEGTGDSSIIAIYPAAAPPIDLMPASFSQQMMSF